METKSGNKPPLYKRQRIPLVVVLLASVMAMSLLCQMQGHGTIMTGPSWDPAGNVPFRTWIRELEAWLNVTSTRLSPSQQAAAIQLGLRGVAREFTLTIPPAAIHHGAMIEGTPTDPVTYLLYTLALRYESLEDERTLTSGTALLDFTGRPGESVDTTLTRFDMARHEAAAVGADINNFHIISTLLLRAIGSCCFSHSDNACRTPNSNTSR